MNLILSFSILILAIHDSYGVIYKLNATEYGRMPPLYKMDDYNSCLQAPSDLYCTVRFNLVADEPNELFQMIKEYSEQYKTHFDHTNVRHGICATKNCKKYIENETSVSEAALEGCLNQTFWENYQLKTRIKRYSCHGLSDRTVTIDNGDVFTGVIVLLIIMLNLIGTIYDVVVAKPEDRHILLSFSLRRNWRTIIPSKSKYEPRLQSLKSLSGLKCMLEYGVILVHCGFIFYIMGENVHDLELSYYTLAHQFLVNLPPLIQYFFVISGFLLIYNMEMTYEKRPLTWSAVAKIIFRRYMRLTPAYAFVILLLATWFKYLGPGPLWEVTREINLMDCRERWWTNLLYFNNCLDNYRCLISSWSNAADMQLFLFGILLYMMLRNSRHKKVILISLTALGSIAVAIHTYVRDLNFGLLFAPNTASQVFAGDDTFNAVYKSAHGNSCNYIIGMGLGYYVYRRQKTKIDIQKYSKYKLFYWFILPLISALMLSGKFFFGDSPKEPLYIRVIYAASIKPIIGILVAILIAGMVFKFENFYRKIFESNFWAAQTKLSYGAYLLHFPCMIVYINMQTGLIHMSTFNLFVIYIYILLASFITAIPLYLFIEAPFTEVAKYLTLPTQGAVTNGKHKKKKMT